MSPTGLETFRTPAALVKVYTSTAAFKLLDSIDGKRPADSSDGRLAWEEAILPPVSDEVCMFRKLHMTSVPLDALSPDEKTTVYSSELDLYLLKANKVITLALYNNSVFVAAMPCKGTHRIDPKAASLYTRTVYEVSQLDKAELRTDGLTVINGTGRGGQALARAACKSVVF